jgi:hypothetical protein
MPVKSAFAQWHVDDEYIGNSSSLGQATSIERLLGEGLVGLVKTVLNQPIWIPNPQTNRQLLPIFITIDNESYKPISGLSSCKCLGRSIGHSSPKFSENRSCNLAQEMTHNPSSSQANTKTPPPQLLPIFLIIDMDRALGRAWAETPKDDELPRPLLEKRRDRCQRSSRPVIGAKSL